MNRLVNLDLPQLPDPKVMAWLEANRVDPRRVWASQKVLVTGTHLAYIGWPLSSAGHRMMTPDREGFIKQAYLAALLAPPEDFGLETEPAP